MADKIVRFSDEKTGDVCELDTVSGIMKRTARDGSASETRMARGDDQTEMALSDHASEYDNALGLSMRDPVAGARAMSVLMDMGIADVHTAQPMQNFFVGYRNEDGIADLVAPVVLVDKPSAKFPVWDSDDVFQAVTDVRAAPGATVREVSPRMSSDNYVVQEYALGGFTATEVQSAADAPLQPMQMTTRRVVQALRIAREIRVAAAFGVYTLYNSGYSTVIDLSGDATTAWNADSANSNPIKNIQDAIELMYMEPNAMIWSRAAKNAFVQNPNVQKYIVSKSGIDPLPGLAGLQSMFDLPPVITPKMKRKGASGLGYIWGNDPLLIRVPSGLTTSGEDISTGYTFRWNGGGTPDGSNQKGGMLVRNYFDERRGPRGGMVTVVTHSDAEKLVGKLVTSMIHGAIV